MTPIGWAYLDSGFDPNVAASRHAKPGEGRLTTQPTEPSRRLAPGGDAGFIAIFALIVAAIVLVDAFSVTHDRAVGGHPVSFWEPFVWETTSGLVFVALAPLVMAITRRHPPRLPPALGWLAWHLPFAVVFSAVHVLAMGVLRWAVFALAGSVYDPLGPLGDWLYELRKDLLTYACLVLVYWVWRSLRPATPARAPDEEVPPIEVRDGARRLFVPVSDILWVEAAGNYVELHRTTAPILHRAPLAEMQRRLADQGFVRIHRSRLVRRDAIAAIETKPSGDFTVRLAGGQCLAGSRRFRSQVLDRAASPD